MKIAIQRLILFACLSIILASILMVIKPGASIFFYKIRLKNKQIKPDVGKAYRYRVDLNPLLFISTSLLLYEDKESLMQVRIDQVVDTGKGTFALDDGFLFFASTDNSNPISNGRKYVLYLPIAFFTRERGLVYLTICLLVLMYLFRKPISLQKVFNSPSKFTRAVDDFVNGIFSRLLVSSPSIHQTKRERSSLWHTILALTIIVSYLFVLMEWLFFVTKPSFMDLMSLREKIDVLSLSGLGLSIASSLVVLSAFGLDSFARHIKPSSNFLQIGFWVPALILASLALILIDNFTYTIFQFGIVNSAGYWRGVYAFIFIILFLFFHGKIVDFSGLSKPEKTQPRFSRSWLYLSGTLLVFSFMTGLLRFNYTLVNRNAMEEVTLGAKRPNILLFGGDGLNAEHLSVYGYERDTTPNLEKIAMTSLIAENAFPQADHSAASTISILTSKLPTQTQVFGIPDILKRSDAYQHLPGLLKRAGYYTVEIAVPHYLDSYVMNLLDGFDEVNGRAMSEPDIVHAMRLYGYSDAIYFILQSADRIIGRLNHIFYIKDIENPYDILTKQKKELSDQKKIDQLLDYFEIIDQPLFIHIHLTSTHGPKFRPRVQVFSKGQNLDRAWMADLYDDAILDWDRYIGDVQKFLEQSGKYDNTIIIFYSDHGMGYTVNDRIPLIIHFPDHEYAGRIQSNVQNLDIAPTILDYLDIPQPDWMHGISLLQANPNPLRPIFGVWTTEEAELTTSSAVIDQKKKKPITHLYSLNLIQCQEWHRIDLTTMQLESGIVEGHTAPCNQDKLFSSQEIREEIVKHLSTNGIDVSTIP